MPAKSGKHKKVPTCTSENAEDLIENYLGPEEDTLCGIGSCSGGPLQALARPIVYLIASSIISLVQGLFFTYSNATLSSIEKDFGLPSKLSGLTTTGNDVIQLILAIPLPFFASKGHRPRWLAFGMFLSSVGCCFAVLPHIIFNFPRENVLIENDQIMDQSHNSSSIAPCQYGELASSNNCGNSNALNNEIIAKVVVALLIVAQMFAGVASLLYYTIGYSYLDEAVSKDKVPLFLSISGAMRLLGPVCGYSLASWALSIWKYPSEAASVSIKPSHPRWVGAWWLGYIVIGSILFGISWVLILMPKTLPATRKRKNIELRKIALNGSEDLLLYVSTLRPKNPQQWNDILPSMRRLASNAVYRLIVIKKVLFWFAFYGYITFKSKFLEHQFRLSAAEANRYIAAVSLLAALVGWLGTGGSMSFFKPKPKTVIIFMAFLSSVSCLCHLGQLSVSCEHQATEGLQKVIQYRSDSSKSNSTICVGQCECVKIPFSPVCSTLNSTYFNSCFAKCSYGNDDLKNKWNESTIKENTGKHFEFEQGFCTPNCPNFVYYLAISVIGKMVNAASSVLFNILLLRCSEERDKDLGLGIFNALIALGSSIPAPIIFGWIIDTSCILWDISCDGKSSCWLYDVGKFRTIIHGIPAAILFLCVLMDLLLLKYHKDIEIYSTSHTKKKKENSSLAQDTNL